jgi:hypothetical protein
LISSPRKGHSAPYPVVAADVVRLALLVMFPAISLVLTQFVR